MGKNMSFRDKTFCASPNCKNECGRKMTSNETVELGMTDDFVSYAYFCETAEEINNDD